jgi:uncharacterized membrane protein
MCTTVRDLDPLNIHLFVLSNTLTGLSDLAIVLIIYYILQKSSSLKPSPLRGFISLFGIIVGLCSLYRFIEVLGVFYQLPIMINVVMLATFLVTSITAYSLYKWRFNIIEWLSNLNFKP